MSEGLGWLAQSKLAAGERTPASLSCTENRRTATSISPRFGRVPRGDAALAVKMDRAPKKGVRALIGLS
jgi:hypothetical protein